VHVTGSVAVWLTALFLPYTLRDRGAQPTRRQSDVRAEHGVDVSLPG
jgi:hypothetical protein